MKLALALDTTPDEFLTGRPPEKTADTPAKNASPKRKGVCYVLFRAQKNVFL